MTRWQRGNDDMTLSCPIQPHQIDKLMRGGLEGICQRVAVRAALDGAGSDLLLRVYLAGIYHGAGLAGPRSKE